MTNNFERQEEITELCVKYTNRELAAMLIDLQETLVDSYQRIDVAEVIFEFRGKSYYCNDGDDCKHRLGDLLPVFER